MDVLTVLTSRENENSICRVLQLKNTYPYVLQHADNVHIYTFSSVDSVGNGTSGKMIFSAVNSCFAITDLLCSSNIRRAAVSSAKRRASASRRALRAAILSYTNNKCIHLNKIL